MFYIVDRFHSRLLDAKSWKRFILETKHHINHQLFLNSKVWLNSGRIPIRTETSSSNFTSLSILSILFIPFLVSEWIHETLMDGADPSHLCWHKQCLETPIKGSPWHGDGWMVHGKKTSWNMILNDSPWYFLKNMLGWFLETLMVSWSHPQNMEEKRKSKSKKTLLNDGICSKSVRPLCRFECLKHENLSNLRHVLRRNLDG